MTVSWLQREVALRWRATDRAVVLASITMLSPSWTRAAAAAPMRRFSSCWRRSRISNESSGRLRSRVIAPPCVRISRCSASSAIRSLRIVTADTPNRAASSLTRARPCSSTKRTMCSCRSGANTSPGAALGGTDTHFLARRWARPTVSDDFRCTVDRLSNAMSRTQLKQIETCGRLRDVVRTTAHQWPEGPNPNAPDDPTRPADHVAVCSSGGRTQRRRPGR